jgi:hypothetical protein
MIVLGFLIILMSCSMPALAGPEENLKGIDRVCVIVKIDNKLQSLGITSDTFTSFIETQLRKGGLKIGEQSDGLPGVVANITMPDNGVFSGVLVIQLSVLDKVIIERNKQRTWAPFWTTVRAGSVGKSFMVRDINATLANVDDILLNDIAKVN